MRRPAHAGRRLTPAPAGSLLLALTLLAACGPDDAGLGGGGGSMSGQPRERKRLHVTVRNNCPGAVEVAFSIRMPGPEAKAHRIAGGGAFKRELSPKERIWLADDEGNFSPDRWARAEADGYFIEIADSCDHLVGRPGRM